MEEKIYLQPLGGVDVRVLSPIAREVGAVFGFPVRCSDAVEVARHAFTPARRQYHSTVLLRELLRHVPGDALRVLGITEVDLYVPHLNFVFGEATVDGRVGIISLHRLHPEFHGDAPDHRLLVERAVKEALHELGHTFGLRHSSNPRCVMYFSNDIEDTDRKSARFFDESARQLALKLRPLRAAA